MKRFRIINLGQSLATPVANLAIKLNEIQSEFHFVVSPQIIEPDHSKKLEDGSYFFEDIGEIIKDFMYKNKYNERPIAITEYPLNDELFSSCDNELAVLSLHNWENFSQYTVDKGLLYLVADALLTFFMDYAPHDKTYGCPNDYCEGLVDINIGMKKAEYCDKCKKLISKAVEQGKITINEVASIYRILDNVIDRTVCFVQIPFEEKFTPIYNTIKKVTNELGIYCSRDSDEKGHPVIIDTIREMIYRADFVVADLSGKNSNVFYELGFAHALNKQSILLTQNKKDVPFDISHRKYIYYKDISDLSDKLRNELKAKYDQ